MCIWYLLHILLLWQTFNFYITVILLNENCTGIRKLLSFISGNVLQRNQPMVKKMLGPSSFPGSLGRGDQNGAHGVQLSAILNHPAAKTLETRFCDDAIGYRRFEIRAGDVRFPLSFCFRTTKVLYGDSLTSVSKNRRNPKESATTI